MRLWTIHPKYLDSKGLVALWREALLAQKVLKGETKGYRFHPQLDRFKNSADPVSSIAFYLHHVHREGKRRFYNFDDSKINEIGRTNKITVPKKIILSELRILKSKLKQRDPLRYKELPKADDLEPHPLFRVR